MKIIFLLQRAALISIRELMLTVSPCASLIKGDLQCQSAINTTRHLGGGPQKKLIRRAFAPFRFESHFRDTRKSFSTLLSSRKRFSRDAQNRFSVNYFGKYEMEINFYFLKVSRSPPLHWEPCARSCLGLSAWCRPALASNWAQLRAALEARRSICFAFLYF